MKLELGFIYSTYTFIESNLFQHKTQLNCTILEQGKIKSSHSVIQTKLKKY